MDLTVSIIPLTYNFQHAFWQRDNHMNSKYSYIIIYYNNDIIYMYVYIQYDYNRIHDILKVKQHVS